MRQYQPEKPLIFIHVPKSAGSSVQVIFRNWYGKGFFSHYINEKTGELPPRISLKRGFCSKKMCIYGHFNRNRGFGIEEYYPMVEQFITIIRDPVELAISEYFYLKANEKLFRDKSKIPDTTLEKYMACKRVNMLEHFPRQVTSENYSELLDRYFLYVGILENLSYSISRIAGILGRPKPNNIPHVNISNRDQGCSPEAIEVFRRNNSLEIELYNYVVNSELYFNS